MYIVRQKKNNGDAGYRSPCPSHAKRMLYHLSYIPNPKVRTKKGHYTQKKEKGKKGEKGEKGEKEKGRRKKGKKE